MVCPPSPGSPSHHLTLTAPALQTHLFSVNNKGIQNPCSELSVTPEDQKIAVVALACDISHGKTSEGQCVKTRGKQNKLHNGMNLIYLKQYFSPFSN